ncbi:MAG: C1 family peptidase [Anaerolineae bacterium]
MELKRLLALLVLLTVILLGPATPAGAENPYKQIPLGLVPSVGEWTEYQPEPTVGIMSTLPSRVDLSEDLPPVKSQGSQGSCVAWAVGYYYTTYQEAIERNWSMTTLDHQLSPAYIYNQRDTSDCNNRNSGMSFWDAFTIVKDQGVAPLSLFPYDASDACTQPTDTVRAAAYPYRAEGFQFINYGDDLDMLKGLLAQGKPIAVAIPIYESFYQITEENPVLPRPASGETFYGGHGMLVVGYDDQIGGFLTVNSWGPNWGMDGYLYLSYEFVIHNVWEAWVMNDYQETQSFKRFQGQVVVNGDDAPEGTQVAAMLNGQVVATTSTVVLDSMAYYVLDVPYASSADGDGSSGSTIVAFEVEGLPAQEQVPLETYQGDPVDLHVYTGPAPNQNELLFIPFVQR